MAPIMRHIARVDDDEVFDDEVFDRRYYPRRVYKDGHGPRVRLMLTDGMPDGMRRLFGDAAERRAVESYEAHKRWLSDAWRGPGSPPPLKDGKSPRDAYIRRLTNAWKPLTDLPARNPDDDDDPKAAATAVEAQRRRWNAESPAKDAALADRDAPITSASTVSRRRGRGPTGPSREDVVDDKACRGAGWADRCGLLR